MAQQPVTESVERDSAVAVGRVKNGGSLGSNRPPLSAKARAARMRRDAEALRQADVGLFLQTVEAIAGQAAAVCGVPAGADHPLASLIGKRKGTGSVERLAEGIDEYRNEPGTAQGDPWNLSRGLTPSPLWPKTMRTIEYICHNTPSDNGDEG